MQARQTNSYRKPPLGSTLKLVGGAAVGKANQLRAGGLEPDDSMQPGQYLGLCEGATVITKGRATIAVLEHRIVDGPHGGTSLRQWITVPVVDGIVPLGSRYAKQCRIALGREIEPGDDLDPAAIFKGKIFRVDVGYRLTVKVGGSPSQENALTRKDGKDFLRVHQILAIGELP